MGLWESLELTTTTVQKIANRGRRPRPVPGVYLTVDSHVGTPPLLQSVRGSSLPVHVVVLRRADARLQVRFHDLDKKDLHPTQTQSTANRARGSALVRIWVAEGSSATWMPVVNVIDTPCRRGERSSSSSARHGTTGASNFILTSRSVFFNAKPISRAGPVPRCK